MKLKHQPKITPTWPDHHFQRRFTFFLRKILTFNWWNVPAHEFQPILIVVNQVQLSLTTVCHRLKSFQFNQTRICEKKWNKTIIREKQLNTWETVEYVRNSWILEKQLNTWETVEYVRNPDDRHRLHLRLISKWKELMAVDRNQPPYHLILDGSRWKPP